MNTTTTTPHSRTASPSALRTALGTQTENLTLETPLLGSALVALVAGVLAIPEVTLLLLGIPAAVVLGVATMMTAARLLAQ